MQDAGPRVEGIRTRAVGAVEVSVTKRVAAIRGRGANPVITCSRRVFKAMDDDIVTLACRIVVC